MVEASGRGEAGRKAKAIQESQESEANQKSGDQLETDWKRRENTDNKWSAVTRCAVVRTQCLNAIPVVKRKVPRQRVADNFDTISGGHNEGVPPVPIPNTEVKPFSAEST